MPPFLLLGYEPLTHSPARSPRCQQQQHRGSTQQPCASAQQH
jgi:hypothetical protein